MTLRRTGHCRRVLHSAQLRTSRSIARTLVAALVLLAACSDSTDDAESDLEPAASQDRTATVDLSLNRDDVDCSPEAVGADLDEFVTVHVVVERGARRTVSR